MKIWIDGKEANQENRVGSGQYAFEVIRNLEKIDQENEYTILLPSPPLPDLPKTRKNWKYRVLKPGRLWTRITLPTALYLTRNKPDLIFSPTHYIPRFSPVKRICTIFDLAYLHFPEMFAPRDLWQLKNWTKFSAEFADKILAISEFTKKDIMKNYDVDPEKITVTPLGFDRELFKPVRDRKKIVKVLMKYRIREPFITYIGTIQPRKNLVRLMEAFSRIDYTPGVSTQSSAGLHTVGGTLQLVVVGKTNERGRKGWMFEDILKTPKQLGIETQVNFTGFVPTEDLPALLSASTMFVLPSLWEGFGIPVLEAMACGAPVVVASVSSLPEVAGKAGVLVDPYSVESISKAIESLLKDEKFRQKKVQLGLEQAKKFSWEDCARKTLEVFKHGFI
ncbi:MAG: Group 1 glycosyl transferase [Microgenomates group bacterium Gr01-1014_80]|nr:MAG: Group 1 glycosyl transferase [Microgenomates group bacterium Gr01-1014_80]